MIWAGRHERRWAFTLSNAGSCYFKDRCDLTQRDEIDWQAVEARYWQDRRDEKQAEFLMEESFPWALVRRVGVHSRKVREQVRGIVGAVPRQPSVDLRLGWCC